MKKNNKKSNTLIKRKNLIIKLKKEGITRISPDAVRILERHIAGYLDEIIKMLKEEMYIKGKKTMQMQDARDVLFKTKENYWEI